MSEQIESHEVDPSRLASGRWDHELSTQIGEGDIAASYSGDRIGLGQPVRKPFPWRNEFWVCTGILSAFGSRHATAYRLESLIAFPFESFSYAERTHDAESARNDPLGFYHSIVVTHRGTEMVLCGPPARFVSGIESQAELFATLNNERSR